MKIIFEKFEEKIQINLYLNDNKIQWNRYIDIEAKNQKTIFTVWVLKKKWIN